MTLLIFDIDGTLIRPTTFEDAPFVNAFEMVFASTTEIDTNWATYEHVTDSGLLDELSKRHLGRPPSPDESNAFRARYESLLAAGLATNPAEGLSLAGAPGFWEAARKREDWDLAFATGNWRSVAELKLDRAGISRDGLPLASADDGVARADLLRVAIQAAQHERNGEPFDRIISIGDAEWDVRAAAELGVPFIGVGQHWQGTPYTACAGCIADFRDHARIFGVIDRAMGT